MRIRPEDGARTTESFEGALRARNPLPYGIHEERRRASHSRSHSARLFHKRGAAERDDRLLPGDWGFCRQSPCEQRRGGRTLSRRQRATSREETLRPEGADESGQDDHVRNRRARGRNRDWSRHEMKTWVPDARNFAYLNWKQVDALPGESTLLVLPTAAIEQHGHHLPLATDTLINNLLLGHALQKLPPEMHVYALPPVHYGKSNEHIGFPGTLSVSATTFMAVLRDLGASLASAGFRRLVLYNTHGGNSSLIDVMARDLRAEFNLRTFSLHGTGGTVLEGLSAQERAYGFHANEVETALLLASMPQLVDRSAHTVNYIADVANPELLLPENAPATFAWLTRDIAPSGVLGDPRPATAENGARAGCARDAPALPPRSDVPLSEPDPDMSEPPLVDCGNSVLLERGVRCRL